MDQTILDSSDPYLFNRPATPEAHVILKGKIKEALNWNVVNIMKRAAALRPAGVTAICLLTNNSSEILVSAVDEVLQEEIGSTGKYRTYKNESAQSMPDKAYFFDAIMMREHFTRPKTVDNNPPKRLEDIQNILGMLKIEASAADILKDIFFFDDIPTHELKTQFESMDGGKYKNNYIHITPPYSKLRMDKTVYVPVLQALHALDGKGTELPAPPPIPAPPAQPRPVGRTSVLPPVSAYPVEVKPPQEQSVHRKASPPRPSVFGAFLPPGTGGFRKSRRRLRRKRTTKKNIQKRR